MQTILVPTDFSASAYNAALYAIALAADIKATKIILYHAYQPYIADDPELGLPLQFDVEEFKQISESGLTKMKNILQAELSSSIELSSESDYNTITNGIMHACKKHNAELIVMSIAATDSKLEEALIGSSAVDVAKQSEIPVIIVPAETKYKKLQKILLALDLKKVASATPVHEIKKLLDATSAQLDVLHVEANNSNETEFENELAIFNSLFSNYNPKVYFLQGKTFVDTINDFALRNETDLIIVIPKKHGLFEGLFKQSHTKALAYHSHIPIMSIHE